MNKTLNNMAILLTILMIMSINKMFNLLSKLFILNNLNKNIMIMSLITMMMISSPFKMAMMNKKTKFNEMSTYMCMSFLSILTFSCNEMIMFFIFFEITVIPMIMIMINFSKEKEKISAMFYMVATNMAFSLPFIMYIIMMKTFNKSSNMEIMKIFNVQNMNMIIFIMMILMLLTKYPMFFFHSWLPKAHVEASTSGSMILASILLKLGTMGMEKNMTMMELMLKKSNILLKMISMNSIIISSILAIRSMDLKKMMAISSISHMAMVLYNTASMKSSSMEFSKLMMISHGIISPLMFMIMGKIYENKKTRSIFSSKNMESSSKSYSMLWFIIIMMNVGIPPMMNVISEILMVFFMYTENIINIFPLCIFLSLSSSISMLFIIKMINLKSKKMMSTKKNESTNISLNTIMSASILLNLAVMN